MQGGQAQPRYVDDSNQLRRLQRLGPYQTRLPDSGHGALQTRETLLTFGFQASECCLGACSLLRL